MLILMIAIFSLLTACSGKSIREEWQEEWDEEYRVENARRKAITDRVERIGCPLEEFETAFSAPHRKEFKEGYLVLRYTEASPPMVFKFKKGKLAEWYSDDATALLQEQRRSNETMERMDDRQASDSFNNNIRQITNDLRHR